MVDVKKTSTGKSYDDFMAEPLPDSVNRGTFKRDFKSKSKFEAPRDTFTVRGDVRADLEWARIQDRQRYRGLWSPELSPELQDAIDLAHAAVDADDEDAIDRVETAMVGYLTGNNRYQYRLGVSLTFADLLNYIRIHKTDLIPQLWMIHSREANAAVRPYRVMVVGQKGGPGEEGSFSGLHVLDADSAAVDDLKVYQLKVTFDYNLSSRRYHVVGADGKGALDVAFAYLEACGVTLNTMMERAFVARLLDGRLEVSHLPLSDLVHEIQTHTNFFQRLRYIRSYFPISSAVFPTSMVFAVQVSDRKEVSGIRLLVGDERASEKLGGAQLYFEENPNGYPYVHHVGGKGGRELGFAWIESQLQRSLLPIEKALAAGLWEAKYNFASDEEAPRWRLLCHYLKTLGALQQLWQIRELIRPTGKPMPDELIVTARNRGAGEEVLFTGFRIMSVGEEVIWPINKDAAQVRLKKNASGRYETVSSRGTGAKELITAIESRGEDGVTIAPDADAKEHTAADVTKYTRTPEGFAPLDGGMCKNEPLITPANLKKVEPLVNVPVKIETPARGFAPTSLTQKDLATPPSVLISSPSGIGQGEGAIVSVDLPATIGGEIQLPEPPIGMVVVGYAVLGGAVAVTGGLVVLMPELELISLSLPKLAPIPALAF